jgi:hypothetical protein
MSTLQRKEDFSELLPIKMSNSEMDESDPYKYCRFFSVQHDCWGSRSAKSFLGVVISYINTWADVEKWCLMSIPLACQPFDKKHTSDNILEETKRILTNYDIPLHYFAASTQDTAANAFGAFANEDVILQHPCVAHRFNLFLQN